MDNIETHFFSKKNGTYLAKHGNERVIIKNYYSKSACDKESGIYAKLKSTPHARYTRVSDTSAHIEYIDAPNFVDLLEEYESAGKSAKEPFLKLIEWLKSFNLETGFIMSDDNLRNFLWTGNGVVGIDFEDAVEGDVKKDIGNIAAYVVSYDPCFTEYKLELAKELLRGDAVAAKNAQEKLEFMCTYRKNFSLPYENMFIRMIEE